MKFKIDSYIKIHNTLYDTFELYYRKCVLNILFGKR
jgi:hypothetical protein